MPNLDELAREQEELSRAVKRYDSPLDNDPILTGLDVAYSDNLAVGYAVVTDRIAKKTLRTLSVKREIESDYIPGFFQLREGPILLELVQKIKVPGTILVDGNGILHPRRFGLASYLGLKLDVQTVGVAKKLLLGNIGARLGNSADIIHENEVLGKALWIEDNKPIFVSIGHRVSLDTATRIVVSSCVEGYPDVLRKAHMKSRELLTKIIA